MKYSKYVSKYLISFAFCALLGCQASDYSNPVAQPPAAPPVSEKPVFENVAEGAINGRAWKFTEGKASLFKRNGKIYLEIKLWNQTYAKPCEQLVGSIYQVRAYSENKVGLDKLDPSDPFSLIPTIIFSDLTEGGNYRNNMVASRGLIQVTSLNNGRVIGSIQGAFTSGGVSRTDVMGTFDVPFCQPLFSTQSTEPLSGSN